MSYEIPGKITCKEQVCNKSGNVDNSIGIVQFGTSSRPIDLDLAPEAQVGDYVLVQGGFAVSRIEEKEAKRLFAELTASGLEVDAELDGGPELERRQKPHPAS
jgi:hydrogenase expression/formation protein HypC